MKKIRLHEPTKSKGGVYMYQFGDNSTNSYIGSTINFYTRYNYHLSKLRHNKHENPKFQRAFNKYGEINLIYKELEIINNSSIENKEILESRERDWQEKYCCKYIIFKGGEYPHYNKEERLKRKMKPIEESRSIKVYQVDSNLEIIEQYKSIREAERKTDIDAKTISKISKLETKNRKGLYFRFESTLHKKFTDKQRPNSRTIVCYDLSANLICEINGVRNVAKKFKVDSANITRCCQEKRDCCRDYIFRYKDSIAVVKPKLNKIDLAKKSVIGLKNGEIVGIYDSFKQASSILHVSRETIKKQCEGIEPKRLVNLSVYTFRYATT